MITRMTVHKKKEHLSPWCSWIPVPALQAVVQDQTVKSKMGNCTVCSHIRWHRFTIQKNFAMCHNKSMALACPPPPSNTMCLPAHAWISRWCALAHLQAEFRVHRVTHASAGTPKDLQPYYNNDCQYTEFQGNSLTYISHCSPKCSDYIRIEQHGIICAAALRPLCGLEEMQAYSSHCAKRRHLHQHMHGFFQEAL